MKICKQHQEPHIIYLTTEENQSQEVRKQFFFYQSLYVWYGCVR